MTPEAASGIVLNTLFFFKPMLISQNLDIYLSGVGKSRPTFKKTDFQFVGVGKHLGIAADQDVESHRATRKTLAPAFSPKSIKAQEPRLHHHVNLFVSQMRELGAGKQGLDMTEVRSQIPLFDRI
jgi:cytochrome P450